VVVVAIGGTPCHPFRYPDHSWHFPGEGDNYRNWQVIAYLQLYFHFFQLKKLSYLRKIDVHIFIFKIKVNTEMGSRKKGKL